MIKTACTKGNQAKDWNPNSLALFKYDSPNCYESIAEVVVSEFLNHIEGFRKGIDFVDYSWFNCRGTSSCVCLNFLKEGEYVIPLYNIVNEYNYEDLSPESLKRTLCGLARLNIGLDIEKYLAYMVYIDGIVLNGDRHLRNISFISDGTTVRPAPYYDFGLSLMSDKTTYPTIEENQVKVAQPFGINFIGQAKLFENPGIVVDYDKLVSKLNHVINHSSDYISIESKAKDLERAIYILLRRLRQTEDILWRRV